MFPFQIEYEEVCQVSRGLNWGKWFGFNETIGCDWVFQKRIISRFPEVRLGRRHRNPHNQRRPRSLLSLGLQTSYQIDGFLKAHDIWIEFTMGVTRQLNPAAESRNVRKVA